VVSLDILDILLKQVHTKRSRDNFKEARHASRLRPGYPRLVHLGSYVVDTYYAVWRSANTLNVARILKTLPVLL
jgi:hypothetical protein